MPLPLIVGAPAGKPWIVTLVPIVRGLASEIVWARRLFANAITSPGFAAATSARSEPETAITGAGNGKPTEKSALFKLAHGGRETPLRRSHARLV